MIAAAALAHIPRPRHGLALALVELREQLSPRTRSRWTLALVQLDATGATALETWHGVGPLGRLRARREALEHCEREQLTYTPHLLETRPTPAQLSHAHAQTFARLRSEGVF